MTSYSNARKACQSIIVFVFLSIWPVSTNFESSDFASHCETESEDLGAYPVDYESRILTANALEIDCELGTASQPVHALNEFRVDFQLSAPLPAGTPLSLVLYPDLLNASPVSATASLLQGGSVISVHFVLDECVEVVSDGDAFRLIVHTATSGINTGSFISYVSGIIITIDNVDG